MYLGYSAILVFIILAFIISGLIAGASFLFSVKNPEAEKISVYECGFDPFGDSRQKFEVKFFLVGILFIIFDLEISFLFPWSIGPWFNSGGLVPIVDLDGYWSMMLFLTILTVGLVYEWIKGGLEWS